MRVVGALRVWTVVAGHQHQRVVGQAQFGQPGQQPTDLGVGTGDLGGVVALALGPGPVGVRGVRRYLVRRVRRGVRKVEEERVLLTALDKVERLLGEQVLRVGDVGGLVLRVEHPHVVAPQVRRPVVVRVPLVEVAEEVVEALAVGVAGIDAVLRPESPLADVAGGVPGLAQDPGHGHVLGRQPAPSVRVGPDPGMPDVPPGHQRAPGRRTGGGGVGLVEPHPLRGQPVQYRSLDDLLAVAAKLSPAQIVEHHQQDVRPGRPGRDAGDRRARHRCRTGYHRRRSRR